MGRSEELERVVAPVLEPAGIELVDLEVRPGSLRITLDRDGGLDLEAIGTASAAISRALDTADAVPGGAYELEVSSPGLERRLRLPEHFRRQVGAEVSVRTKPGVEGERRVDGRLVAADDDGVVVETALPAGRRTIAYDDIERARTVFDWKAALSGTEVKSARREHKAARKERRTPEKKPTRNGTRTR